MKLVAQTNLRSVMQLKEANPVDGFSKLLKCAEWKYSICSCVMWFFFLQFQTNYFDKISKTFWIEEFKRRGCVRQLDMNMLMHWYWYFRVWFSDLKLRRNTCSVKACLYYDVFHFCKFEWTSHSYIYRISLSFVMWFKIQIEYVHVFNFTKATSIVFQFFSFHLWNNFSLHLGISFKSMIEAF